MCYPIRTKSERVAHFKKLNQSNIMKAKIVISGQISGNFKLRSALDNGTSKKTMFNGFSIEFETIGKAKQAIKEGLKYIKDNNNGDPYLPRELYKEKDNSALYFDASKALIEINQ